MQNYCGNCGAPLKIGSKFCAKCGQPVRTYSTTTPKVSKPQQIEPEKKGGCGKTLLILVLVALVIFGVVKYIRQKDDPKIQHQPKVTQTTPANPKSEPKADPKSDSKPSQNTPTAGFQTINGTTVFSGEGFSEQVASDVQKGGVSLGGMQSASCKLFVENGTFPEGVSVKAEPASQEQLVKLQQSNKFDMIVTPMNISCQQYDGAFFGSDVILTMPMPKLVADQDMDQGKYVFVYFDEATKKMRYLWPTDFDKEKNTMSVRLPHFSPWFSAKLTEEEEVEAFLDSYCTKLAVEQSKQKKAAAELEPYVQAKVKALGLTKEAAKDLLQATVNVLVTKATTEYEWDDEEKVFDYQENFIAGTGTKFLTNTIRGAWDDDPEVIESGFDDLTTSSLMEAWNDLGFSKRAAKSLFKSEYVQEFVPDAINTPLSNMGGVASMAGRFAGGDTEGAMKELGNILQGVHPAVELSTKGARFLATAANTAFTYWKANEVEELYHVYKNGTSGWFGNSVEPCDRESFIEYLNYSGGFTKAKGVYRFYNMDKVAEVCERFGWSRSEYENLGGRYKEIFEKRAEDGLMEYFELRRKQEAEAERLKALERICIKDMMNPYTGVLHNGNYASFFGEQSYKDFNITNRLERLVKVRLFISQYVNEEELAKTAKIEDSYNYGSLLNEWVGLASRYPKAQAVEKFCEYLKSVGLLKKSLMPEAKKPEPNKKQEDHTAPDDPFNININNPGTKRF